MAKKITVVNNDLDVPFEKESSILELLIENDIDIDHSCGGMGSCGTCRILIHSDHNILPKRNEIEQERADDLSFNDNERLACQLCPIDNLKIKIP